MCVCAFLLAEDGLSECVCVCVFFFFFGGGGGGGAGGEEKLPVPCTFHAPDRWQVTGASEIRLRV